MQKTCCPDVATESSFTAFKIPKILHSNGIWQITSHSVARCLPVKCLKVVASNFNKLFDDGPPFTTYQEKYVHPPSCAKSYSFSSLILT